MGTECICNKLIIQLCFVDLVLFGVVKLRLFNGYMSDDPVLSSLMNLHGYSEAFRREYHRGMKLESKEKDPPSPGLFFRRRNKRSKTLPTSHSSSNDALDKEDG